MQVPPAAGLDHLTSHIVAGATERKRRGVETRQNGRAWLDLAHSRVRSTSVRPVQSVLSHKLACTTWAGTVIEADLVSGIFERAQRINFS
jgi:hypothetical protein